MNIQSKRSGHTFALLPLLIVLSTVHPLLATIQKDQKASASAHQNKDDGWTVLHQACCDGKEEEVAQLLRNPATDPNAREKDGGETPLHLASEKGYREIVALLLQDKRVDPNATDKNGHTPLQLAKKYEQVEVVALLLQDQRVNADLPN
jgi:ankyrin repeat protein